MMTRGTPMTQETSKSYNIGKPHRQPSDKRIDKANDLWLHIGKSGQTLKSM